MVVEYINTLSSSPLPPTEDPHPQFITTSFTEKLICTICLDVVRTPVHLYCDNTVCAHCCCKHIQTSYSLQCPCCSRHALSSETISTPSPLFQSLLNESIVVCYRKCGNMVKLQDYTQHLNNHCTTHHVNNSPSKVTLKDVLSQPSTSPATPVERQAAQHLVRRLMHQEQGAPGVVHIPTGGQVNKGVPLPTPLQIII